MNGNNEGYAVLKFIQKNVMQTLRELLKQERFFNKIPQEC